MVYNTIFALNAVDLFSPENLAGYLSTAVVAILGFLITWFLLKKLLYKPIQKIMKSREKVVEAGIIKLEERETALSQREADLAAAKVKQEEAQALQLEQTRLQVQEEREKILSQAKSEADAIVAKAMKTAAEVKAEDEKRLADQSTALSMDLLAALLHDQGAADSKEAQVKQMVNQMLAKKE